MKPTFKRMFLILGVLILITFLPSCEPVEEPRNEVITSGATQENLIPFGDRGREFFNNCGEINAYFNAIDSKKYSFYYLNVDEIMQTWANENLLKFNYNKNNAEDLNAFISIATPIFDDAVGYDEDYLDDNLLDGVLRCSYRMLQFAYPFKYNGGEFSYKLFKYDDGETLYNNVFYVYYEQQVVCKIFYQRKIELKQGYFKNLFENYGTLI